MRGHTKFNGPTVHSSTVAEHTSAEGSTYVGKSGGILPRGKF